MYCTKSKNKGCKQLVLDEYATNKYNMQDSVLHRWTLSISLSEKTS